jgi:acid phosphatase type 7
MHHHRRLLILLLLAFGLTDPAYAGLKVYAAGDIAECDASIQKSAAARTAALIPDGGIVLVLGDTTYPNADTATLNRCYEPTWGRFKASSYVVPGNHDYVNGEATDFLTYFGARNPGKTWFRAPLGESWWVIGLDSNLKEPALTQQQAWLMRELATIKGDGKCVVALWHHALFSTGLHHGDGDLMKPAWRALDAAGADLVLSGHEHFYESFEPLDANGDAQAVGIREFVVGTGGGRLADLSFHTNHRVYTRRYGVLKLDLESDHYRWVFETIGHNHLDAGSAHCRNAVPDNTH